MLDHTDQIFSVLIVDDDARFRRALSRCLELDGHRVEAVGTATQALEQARVGHWDVICLDAQLPDIPGAELAPRLRLASPSAYLIMVTGFACALDDPSLLASGVDAVLPKPWKVEELEDVLGRVQGRLTSSGIAGAA